MSSVSNIGYEKYEPAKKSEKLSKFDHIKFFAAAFCTFLLCFVQFTPQLCGIIFRAIFGTKPKDVRGQLALVTGGGNGLGKEIAIELAKVGCNIAVVDLDIESAENLAQELFEKYNVQAKAFRADVAKFDEIAKLRNDIENSLGFVDILVNNAGVMPFVSLKEGTPDDIQRIIDVNLVSQFWTNRVFLDGMIERKRGHIVNISSLAGVLPIPKGCAYSASKHGTRAMMGSLYFELCVADRDKDIILTGVYPCFIKTRKDIDTILEKGGVMSIPLDPNDCARDIVYGVLRNKDYIIMPRYFSLLVKFSEWFPKEFWKIVMWHGMKNPGWNFSAEENNNSREIDSNKRK